MTRRPRRTRGSRSSCSRGAATLSRRKDSSARVDFSHSPWSASISRFSCIIRLAVTRHVGPIGLTLILDFDFRCDRLSRVRKTRAEGRIHHRLPLLRNSRRLWLPSFSRYTSLLHRVSSTFLHLCSLSATSSSASSSSKFLPLVPLSSLSLSLSPQLSLPLPRSLPLSRRVRTYLRNAVVRARRWRFGLTNSAGAEGRKDRLVVGGSSGSARSGRDTTRSRARGVVRGGACARTRLRSLVLSPFFFHSVRAAPGTSHRVCLAVSLSCTYTYACVCVCVSPRWPTDASSLSEPTSRRLYDLRVVT